MENTAEKNRIDQKIHDCFGRIECHLANEPEKVIKKIIKEKKESSEVLKGSILLVLLIKAWNLIF